MLIGDTYYYRYRRGVGFRLNPHSDSNTPSHVSDDRCTANEVQVWRCTNGDPNTREVAAGATVRELFEDDAAILDAIARIK